MTATKESPVDAEVGRAGVADEILVGRRVELDRLDRVIDDVRLRGAAILLTGEPGIGKSSLVRAVSRRARETGCCVVETTGVQSEEGLAFARLQWGSVSARPTW